MTDYQRMRRSERRFLAAALLGPLLVLALLALLTFASQGPPK